MDRRFIHRPEPAAPHRANIRASFLMLVGAISDQPRKNAPIELSAAGVVSLGRTIQAGLSGKGHRRRVCGGFRAAPIWLFGIVFCVLSEIQRQG
ncbi:MAG: hypothetical protein KGI99_13215 [Bradyrhizobium sp.]|uniref:hypothetical protein n=1 Tax=Bradyrhizobium sp. TaxID=376 RepID=UPI001C289AAA|nr:hypothetical protein [Bradyrhizobium sp.]MBU6462941.1 hypothetical protein [Pseudomonadota bacterium]MDE2068144.1 hypothetical protein [Bradyrhizobium sp.]